VGRNDFAPGDRVKIKGFPFTGRTGTVIGRDRHLGQKLWTVELDQPGPSGGGLFHGRSGNLVKLDPDDDPRQYRV
jgi:hypothetical protein